MKCQVEFDEIQHLFNLLKGIGSSNLGDFEILYWLIWVHTWNLAYVHGVWTYTLSRYSSKKSQEFKSVAP